MDWKELNEKWNIIIYPRYKLPLHFGPPLLFFYMEIRFILSSFMHFYCFLLRYFWLKHLKYSKNGLIQIFFRDKRLRLSNFERKFKNIFEMFFYKIFYLEQWNCIKNAKQKDGKRIKSFIPVKFRVIFAQTVTLIWNTYLSWKANLSTRKQK